MKHKNRHKIYANLIILTAMLIIFSAGTNALCENFDLQSFGPDQMSTSEIDCAILANLQITNEQFKLASYNLKSGYVLGEHADYSQMEQRNAIQGIFSSQAFEPEENLTEIAIYYSWLYGQIESGTENKWDFMDTICLENIISKSAEIINKKIPYLLNNPEAKPENLFIFYAKQAHNLTFLEIAGEFEAFYQDNKTFETKGERSVAFTMKDIAIFREIGFSNFTINQDGSIGAKTFNGLPICENCKATKTPEGIHIQGNDINLPKGFKLNSGSVTIIDENKFRFYENSQFTDPEEVIYTATKTTEYNYMQECENSIYSCIEAYYSDEEGYLGIYLKDNNQMTITNKNNAFGSINLGKITDQSSLRIISEKGEAFLNSIDVKTRGDFSTIVLFQHDSQEGECTGFLGSFAYNCIQEQERPPRPDDNRPPRPEDSAAMLGETITQRALQIKQRHDWFIDTFGVGTHYGTKSDFKKYVDQKKLSPEEAWASSALCNLNLKGMNAPEVCAKKIKDLKNNGFNNNQLIAYYFVRRSGLDDEEALEKVKNNDFDSRLLDDAPTLKLVQTDCVSFVEEVLSLVYSDWNKEEVFDQMMYHKNVEFVTDTGPSGYYLVHFLKQKRNWQTIFLSPTGDDTHLIITDKNTGKKRYWTNKNSGIPIDIIIKDYYKKPEENSLKYLNQNILLQGGVGSVDLGYHMVLLIRDPEDNKLKIIEQHWKKDPDSKNNFEITPLEEFYARGKHIIIAVPPNTFTQTQPQD